MELNSTDTPARTPVETGRDKSNDRATHTTPNNVAIIAGHEPKPVYERWNPGKSQCAPPANANSVYSTAHVAGDVGARNALAIAHTDHGNITSNPTATAANCPCKGSVSRSHA